jgi:rubrerythrin
LAKTRGKKENAYMTETANTEGSGIRSLTSRRSFLAGSAAALAGGALMAVPGMAQAHTTPEPPRDIDVLNYALTLEHLEYAFYRDGLKRFDRLDFRRFFGPRRGLPPKAGLLDVAGSKVYDYFQIIREHEDTHVDTLTKVITDLGGKPVPEATYNFRSTAFTSLKKFIAVAQELENTGVSAYDGAIAHIESAGLLTAGATIATVEARHAAFLNLLNGDVPFPEAFDNPVAPRTICEAVEAKFIVSTPEPYGPYRDLDVLCAKLPTTTTP